MFHGVIGEDDSDARALKVLIGRIRTEKGLAPVKIRPHGFGGCPHLIRKGGRFLRAWQQAGCQMAYVCYDTDRDPPSERAANIRKHVVNEARLKIPYCLVLPVQEIEAWFLADAEKLGSLFAWCRGVPQRRHPERIADPKEYIRSVSRNPVTGKYLYNPASDNERMADLVGLDAVAARCPSFRAFYNCVK